MKEYFTKALVLDHDNAGETDRRILLYTEELGKVSAKAKSARKITSKLAGHLEPMNFSDVRLIEKGGLQVVDALSFEKIEKSKENLKFLWFVKEMTFDFQPDRHLWSFIKRILHRSGDIPIPYRDALKITGFDPSFATCQSCQGGQVNYFSPSEQVFLCKRCAPKNLLATLVEI